MFFYKPCIKIVYAYQKCVCKVCVYIHVYVCIYVDMCMCVYIQLPPEQCRVGVLTPAQSKILLLPQNFSHPSESTKDWFQKYPPPPPQIPKSTNAKVPYTKWHGTMHTVHLSHSWIPNCRSNICTVFDLWLAESMNPKLTYMKSWLCIY